MRSKSTLKITFVVMKIILVMILMATTTFALFTDEDATQNVRVTAGSIHIDLLQADENGVYTSIVNENGDVFKGSLWEPNYAKVIYLQVQNNSEIHVKYTLRFNTMLGEMDGALEYCAFLNEGGVPIDTTNMTWESFSQGQTVSMLNNGYNPLSGTKYVALAPGESHYYAVAVHMLAESTNEYQNQSCILDINVWAVQGNADVEIPQ